MKIDEILKDLKDIQIILVRGSFESNRLLKIPENSDKERIYLLGYTDGRLKQLINDIEKGLPKKRDKEIITNEKR